MSSTSPGGWAGCSSLTKAKKNKGPGAWAWEALSKRPAHPTSTIVESRVTASTGKEGVVHMSCRVRPPGAADGTRTCIDFVHVSIPPFAAWGRRQGRIEGCLVFFVREAWPSGVAIECLAQIQPNIPVKRKASHRPTRARAFLARARISLAFSNTHAHRASRYCRDLNDETPCMGSTTGSDSDSASSPCLAEHRGSQDQVQGSKGCRTFSGILVQHVRSPTAHPFMASGMFSQHSKRGGSRGIGQGQNQVRGFCRAPTARIHLRGQPWTAPACRRGAGLWQSSFLLNIL
jgi:hypothetical protein